MAVGVAALPPLIAVEGVRLGVAAAGIKVPGRKDLVVFELAKPSQVAGVFTQNKFCAAPVVIAREHLSQTSPRYFIINTGNANAGNGAQGLQDAMSCCQHLAKLGDCDTSEVLPFSTGVIGEPLPVNTIIDASADALDNLGADYWAEAATGIMTTDTRPKGASTVVSVAGVPVTITGISKGAGMIKPNMATMLAFVATDAPIPSQVLQPLLAQVVGQSFNRITVDGDTSTNDACILIATGQAELAPYNDTNSPLWQPFRDGLKRIFQELAHAIVRDAEGATKFIRVMVENALDSKDALEVAYTIAHSALVKTAFFASDPNWGRILAAIGRARINDLMVERLTIWLNDLCIVSGGERALGYEEAAGQAVMAQADILVRVNLGMGNVTESVWTSDLSHEYVRINAEYRT